MMTGAGIGARIRKGVGKFIENIENNVGVDEKGKVTVNFRQPV
jgi:hypothetical protein